VREKTEEERREEEEAIQKEVERMMAMGNQDDQEADRFLRDFVMNKRWVDPDKEEVSQKKDRWWWWWWW